jgi:hypothetical protein
MNLNIILVDNGVYMVYNWCMRVQIQIPKKLLEELDGYCISNGYTRSEFIRQCIRSEMTATSIPNSPPFPSVVPTKKELKQKVFSTGDPYISTSFTGDPIPMTTMMAQKSIRMCKHGSAIGNCKFGCKS